MEKFLKNSASLMHKIATKAVYKEAEILFRKGCNNIFYKNIMAPEFDYKPFLNKINPYFAQWGFKFNMVEAEYFSLMSGVKSDIYITSTLFYHYLMPFLGVSNKYVDKNLFRKFLNEKAQNKKLDFRMPQQVIYNMNGIFYDGNDECITIDEAVDAVMAYHGDIISKPTYRTTWGKGVHKLEADKKDKDKVREMFANYKKDYSFEECVVQHNDMASLNKSSLNTTRIVTYRRPNGVIKYLLAFQRFGREGEVVDNASAGGNFLGVEDDGTLHRTIKQFKSLKTTPLSDNVVKKIPFFERMKETAIYLHSKIPDLNYIGWDFTISQDGQPIVIEFNNYASTDVSQITTGPAFSKEDLDELMPLVATRKPSYNCFPTVAFGDERGHGGRLR